MSGCLFVRTLHDVCPRTAEQQKPFEDSCPQTLLSNFFFAHFLTRPRNVLFILIAILSPFIINSTFLLELYTLRGKFCLNVFVPIFLKAIHPTLFVHRLGVSSAGKSSLSPVVFLQR